MIEQTKEATTAAAPITKGSLPSTNKQELPTANKGPVKKADKAAKPATVTPIKKAALPSAPPAEAKKEAPDAKKAAPVKKEASKPATKPAPVKKVAAKAVAPVKKAAAPKKAAPAKKAPAKKIAAKASKTAKPLAKAMQKPIGSKPEFREGSTFAKAFAKLLSGKKFSVMELFAGMGDVKDPARVAQHIRYRGNQTGRFTIENKGGTWQMTKFPKGATT